MKKIILLFFFWTILAIGQSPSFNWAQQIGSTKTDQLIYTAVASDESVFTVSGYQNGGSMLLKKFSPTGTEIFSKTIYGAEPSDLFIDPDNAIYVVGNFKQIVDFDPNAGVTNLGYVNYTSINFYFMAKYSADGNLILAKSTGGIPKAVCADSARNIYITGTFSNSADFDPSPTVTNTQTSFDGYSMFITKLNSAGTFVWNKVIGRTTKSNSGFGTTQGLIITNDASDNLVIAGSFTGDVDFDTSAGVTSYGFAGGNVANPFTLKLTTNGDFIWAKYFHSNQNSQPQGMALDAQGNIYTTGVFQRQLSFDGYAQTLYLYHQYQLVPYISKMASDGTILWAKKIFSTDYSVEMADLKLDNAGNIYTLGTFRSSVNYTTTTGNGSAVVPTANYQNIFFTILNSVGDLVSFNHFGGPVSSYANLAKDLVVKNNSLYITGTFSDTVDFDASNAVFNLTSNGLQDNFIVKYSNTNLSTNSFQVQNNVAVFPNPSSGVFHFSAVEAVSMIKVLNFLGQEINAIISQNTIDLSQQPAGIYFVKFQSQNGAIETQKIIKN